MPEALDETAQCSLLLDESGDLLREGCPIGPRFSAHCFAVRPGFGTFGTGPRRACRPDSRG